MYRYHEENHRLRNALHLERNSHMVRASCLLQPASDGELVFRRRYAESASAMEIN